MTFIVKPEQYGRNFPRLTSQKINQPVKWRLCAKLK
jgi:hypothetical protein